MMTILDALLGLQWWQVLLAGAVLVIGAARLTRLITHDAFPPIVRVRIWYEDHVPEDWGMLVHCPWCMGPWMTLIGLVLFIVTILTPGIAFFWWFFYGWMALSYLTSQYVHFDEGTGE
jgi:hypothetical protein